jgi:hypothetical protein
MTPRPAAPGLHTLIAVTTPVPHETHRYVLPVVLRRQDGVPCGPSPALLITADADGGTVALVGVEEDGA